MLQFHGVNRQSLTLQEAANLKLLSEQQCIYIFVDICTILEHVHSKGYLHNDIKSNNIILEKKEEDSYVPYLIYFGKSHLINTEPQNAGRQKRPYLAPEVCNGELQSTASDIYSVGYMLRSTFRQLQKENFKNVAEIVEKSTCKNIGLT